MEHKLNLNPRAFKAIKGQTKRIEIRVTTDPKRIDYSKFKTGEIILFYNDKKETIKCLILKINWYKTIRELLTNEGTEHTLSSTSDLEEGIKSINSISNYKEKIVDNGVYAIHLKLIE